MKKIIKKALLFFLVFVFFASFAPNLILADQRSEVGAFVTRFYQECLSRDPDASGLNGWTDQLISGAKTGADVAYGFVFSTEFVNRGLSNNDFVTIMYKAFFNRPPDPSGLNGWVGELNRGRSRQFVLAGFVNSQEFKNLCAGFGINPGTLGAGTGGTSQTVTPQPPTTTTGAGGSTQIAAFVTRFYQLCLSRDPDQNGLNGWVNELASKRKTGADVAQGFVFSQEFTNRNVSNTEFVTIMYNAFFNRPPDPSGLNGWVGELNNGRSRQFVLAGFVNSTEFKNLSASFGINAGSMTVRETATTVPQTEGNIRNIVVLGDSQVVNPRVWPEYLKGLMQQNYPQYDFRLYKSGKGGEVITQGASRVSSLYAYRPSIYIIHYGTNDANGPHVGSFRVQPSTFGSTLSQMIDKIRRETGAMVVVMSTGPSYNREQSHPMGNLSTMNSEAQRICQAKGALYVDVFNAMVATGNHAAYLSDGLHYNDAGSQFVATIALNAIKTQFQ